MHTCEPADPASKGGTENTVKLAKADLVPTDANLLGEYATFAELEAACEVFCGQVNDRAHRVTRRVPAEMLAEEQARLHRLPARPHTVAFGVTRTVPVKTAMVSFERGQYSVPGHLLGQQVWVRAHGVGDAERVVVVHVGASRAGRGRPAPPRDPRLAADRRHPLPRPGTGRRTRAGTASHATLRRPTSSPSATARGCG